MCKTNLFKAPSCPTHYCTATEDTSFVLGYSRVVTHPAQSFSGTRRSVMHLFIFAVFLAFELRGAAAWSPSVKYAVNCPERCSAELCGSTQRCRRTVLDDCGCCQVCAAGRGEHCYRTVSGMHGVKCGAGLYCDFYKDEDEYGDEYGICKECMYGTYGVECRKTCTCKAGGLCDRETGACLTFKFLAKMASNLKAHEGDDIASGDGSSSTARARHAERSDMTKGLPPR